jgi:hypothetical protein
VPVLHGEALERWRDMVVVDRDGATVGTIAGFLVDAASGAPSWALVRTGWFGDRLVHLPVRDAWEFDGEIRVPYDKAKLRAAPPIEAVSLTADDELLLIGHYGLHDLRGAVAEPGLRLDSEDREAGVRSHGLTPEPPAAPSPGPVERVEAPPGRGAEVIRSEEELRVRLRTRLRRVRVRKYVVTDYVTRTFPVRREEVVVEPLPDAAAGIDDLAEADARPLPELVLHREEPEVSMRVVPVERVRVSRRPVLGQRTVSARLGREQVEVEQSPPGGG